MVYIYNIYNKTCKIFEEIKWISFTIPALVFYLSFFIIPSLSSVYYSFTDWNGLNSNFIGLRNYADMLKDKMIISSLSNTLFYTICITLLQNTVGLFFAIILSKKWMKNVFVLRALFFLPYIISTLVLGYVWSFILEPNLGPIKQILRLLHLDFLTFDWLGNAVVARFMIVVFTVWQCFGYNMVIFLAGLSAIPDELYEAGHIDGVNSFNEFKHITFPLLAPSFTINIMLTTMGCLKLFDQVYALTGGGPGYSTDSIATTIYNLGFRNDSRWGYGTSMSIVLFIFILLVSAILVNYLRGREVEIY